MLDKGSNRLNIVSRVDVKLTFNIVKHSVLQMKLKSKKSEKVSFTASCCHSECRYC